MAPVDTTNWTRKCVGCGSVRPWDMPDHDCTNKATLDTVLDMFLAGYPEDPCGAYPPESTCARCGHTTQRREPAAMQGRWYSCTNPETTCPQTLVIDFCECGADDEKS